MSSSITRLAASMLTLSTSSYVVVAVGMINRAFSSASVAYPLVMLEVAWLVAANVGIYVTVAVCGLLKFQPVNCRHR